MRIIPVEETFFFSRKATFNESFKSVCAVADPGFLKGEWLT